MGSDGLSGGILDGVDDVLVAGATAQVAGDAFADSCSVGLGFSFSRLTPDMIMPGVQYHTGGHALPRTLPASGAVPLQEQALRWS